MNLEERVILAQSDKNECNNLINEYINFILSCASAAIGRRVEKDDDAFSVAMIAFNEAIMKYDSEKGAFLSFSKLIIKRREMDYLRTEYTHKNELPFSTLSDDDDGVFDIKDERSGISDTALEIECANAELKCYGISFFELPKFSPKSFKTKHGCQTVIKYILNNNDIINEIKKKKILPNKRIIDDVRVSEKLLERHRKYIMAAVILLSGEYYAINEYFSFAKRGGKR